jgi:hypothetical protein
MSPGVMISGSIQIGSVIKKLMGWGYTDTQRQHGDLIRLLLLVFFQNKESRLKTLYAYYITETHSSVSEINREKGQIGEFQIKQSLY